MISSRAGSGIRRRAMSSSASRTSASDRGRSSRSRTRRVPRTLINSSSRRGPGAGRANRRRATRGRCSRPGWRRSGSAPIRTGGHRMDLGQPFAGERLELRPGRAGADRQDVSHAVDPRQLIQAGEAQEDRRLAPLLVPLDAQLGAARDDDRAWVPGLEGDGVLHPRRAEERPPAGLDQDRPAGPCGQLVDHPAGRIDARQPPRRSGIGRHRGIEDRQVARASAEVAGEARAQGGVVNGGSRTRGRPRSRRRTPACRIRTASRGDRSSPAGPGWGLRGSQALDGHDVRAVELVERPDARRGGPVADRPGLGDADQDRAGAAIPLGTADLGAAEPPPIAEELDQGREDVVPADRNRVPFR